MDDIKEEILRINNKYLYENKIENAETVIINNIIINKVNQNFANVKKGFIITEKIEDNYSQNNDLKEEENDNIQSPNSDYCIFDKKTTKQLKAQRTKAPPGMIKKNKNKDKNKEKENKKSNGCFLWCIPKFCS